VKLAQSRTSVSFLSHGQRRHAGCCAKCAIAATDISALVAFAQKERIDLTVVGPEVPLVNGLMMHLLSGLRALGRARSQPSSSSKALPKVHAG